MDSTQTDDRTDIEILTDFFIELENQDVLLKKFFVSAKRPISTGCPNRQTKLI